MANQVEGERRGSTGLALKAGAWYVISTFLVKGLSFITTPIFSRLMSPADYGEFSNYASWQTTLLILTGAELYNTVARAYYDFKDDFDKYVSSVTVASIAVTALLYGVFLLCGDWIYRIVSIPPQFVHMMFFTLTFQSCKQIFLARERTLYRYKSVAAMSVINVLVPTLVAVVMVVLAKDGQQLPGRIYGFYGPSAAIGIVCGAVLLLRGKSFRIRHCSYAFKLSLPLLLHYLTAYLLTSVNVIVAKNVLGADAAAVVSITTSTSYVLTLLLQAVSGAITTWLMDCLDQKRFDTARKGVLLYCCGVAFLGICVILVAPELVWILGGSRYASAVQLMPGLMLAAVIQAITTIFTIILTYQKRVLGTAVCTAAVAVVSIAAKIFLLPVLGVQALAWINAIAFAVLFVCGYVMVRRDKETSKAVNIKGLTAIVLGTFLTALAGYLLYGSNLIRWCVIGAVAVAILIVAYQKRALILDLVRKKLRKK